MALRIEGPSEQLDWQLGSELDVSQELTQVVSLKPRQRAVRKAPLALGLGLQLLLAAYRSPSAW